MCAPAYGESQTTPPPSDEPQRAAWARAPIRIYQEYLSALKMGPTCRFEPTCSNYALTALSRFGTVKGTLLTLGRLARCGPWHPGGWDPVPVRHQHKRQ